METGKFWRETKGNKQPESLMIKGMNVSEKIFESFLILMWDNMRQSW